jgi:hypothetical protein
MLETSIVESQNNAAGANWLCRWSCSRRFTRVEPNSVEKLRATIRAERVCQDITGEPGKINGSGQQ